uniref:Uncharacterized protein n=1 Tax=viral metagenome TaxID=1070528 RepID=A0A6C0I0S8_9ZZZZ
MEHLVRTNIDFANSALSTTGNPFTPKDWDSIHLNVKDREIALVMSTIGKGFIDKNIQTPPIEENGIKNKDFYKITRGAIIDLILTNSLTKGLTNSCLTKGLIKDEMGVEDTMALANKYIKNSNNKVSDTIYLSDFVANINTHPIIIEIEYQARPASEKKVTKFSIVDRSVNILYNMIIAKINLATNKYNYILYYNNALLTDNILENIETNAEINTEIRGKRTYPKIELKIFNKKNGQKTGQKVLDMKTENAIFSLFNDIKNFKTKLPLSESKDLNIKNNILLISYMIYWGLHILLNNVNNQYQIIDCIISLKKCLQIVEAQTLHSADNIILDINIILEHLTTFYNHKYTDIMSAIANNYPMLINNSTFSLSTNTYGIKLYPEQAQVLDIISRHIQDENETYSPQTPNTKFNRYTISPALIGYKVPPSGGKTILSIALGEMIANFPNKTLIYICYNKLVRLSVANACKLANMPFWVVNNCKDISISYIGRVNGKRTHMPSFEGSLIDKYEFYKACGKFHRVKVIISDITSAVELLSHNSAAFVIFLDEPTAGAENGIGILKEDIIITPDTKIRRSDLLVENDIQKLNAKIIHLCINTQLILASSTLPRFNQIDVLNTLFNPDNMYYIESNKMPVSCMAIHPDGYEILPHELAETMAEFRIILLDISQGNSKNIKFYTFDKVRQIALAIEDQLPEEFKFNNYFNDICLLSPQFVHNYIIQVFGYLNTLSDEALEEIKLLIYTINEAKIYNLENILKDGKMLIVSSRDYYKDSIMIGLTPCIKSIYEQCNIIIPDLKNKLKEFDSAKVIYSKEFEKFNKSSQEEKDNMGGEPVPPEFIWSYKVGNSSALLFDEELQLLPYEVSATILSGIGIYDPIFKSELENSISIRESTNGRLATLFATPDITYGTNMALITIYIDKCYGQQTTSNSLYQVIGRAGRVGKEYKARVIFNDIDTMKKALLSIDDAIEPGVMDFYLQYNS